MSLRRDLEKARDEQRLVRLVRRKGWQKREGYVVAVGKSWSALLAVEPGLLDGLVLFRTKDVRRLDKPHANRRLARKVVTQAGHWPPTLPDQLDLHDIRTVLFTSGSLAPALAFACERGSPGRFFVGRVHRITGRKLTFEQINPLGRWSSSWRYRLDEITRVDLRTPYVTALTAIASQALSS